MRKPFLSRRQAFECRVRIRGNVRQLLGIDNFGFGVNVRQDRVRQKLPRHVQISVRDMGLFFGLFFCLILLLLLQSC